jgi:thiol-disulfide isomerase/thioredoxin
VLSPPPALRAHPRAGSRPPRCPRHGGIISRRAGARLTTRPRASSAVAGAVAGAVVALAASLALAACDSGPIGQSTAASNGQSFVSGNAGTTVYGAGSGPMVPKVTGTMLTGQKFALTQDRGHVVVLNFWGSWCTPCRAEAPTLASLAQHFTSSGVRFLGVDIRDSPTNAEAFLSSFRIHYPSLNDPGDEIALDFQDTVPPAAIPTTLVIGRNGRIAARVIGEVSYPGLRGLIGKAVAESS